MTSWRRDTLASTAGRIILDSLPAEAGCVMNPVVRLFHACYAAQRKMTKSVKRMNLISAVTAAESQDTRWVATQLK